MNAEYSSAEMTEFVRLRFGGGRFELSGAGMPVDMLGDVIAYQDLLLSLAKMIYRQRNPNRIRIPKRFTAALDLRLTEVRKGSRTPVLERPTSVGQQPLGFDEYTEAQRLIEAVFGKGDNVGSLPPNVPAITFSPLRALGRTLASDEYIEVFREAEGAEPLARYSMAKRTALLGMLQQATPAPIEHIVRIVGLQTETLKVTLRLDGGDTLSGIYDDDLFPVIKNGLGDKGQGPRHLLLGTVLVDPNGVRRGLDSIDILEDVEADLLAFERARGELDAVAELKDGWLDGEGVPVGPVRQQAALSFLAAIQDERYPAPTAVSATIDGAVRLEWHRPDVVTTVDFEDGSEIDVVSTTRGSPSWIQFYATVEEMIHQIDQIGNHL